MDAKIFSSAKSRLHGSRILFLYCITCKRFGKQHNIMLYTDDFLIKLYGYLKNTFQRGVHYKKQPIVDER